MTAIFKNASLYNKLKSDTALNDVQIYYFAVRV